MKFSTKADSYDHGLYVYWFLYSYGGWCMLNGFARYVLTASSVAPVCLTLAFLAYINDNYKILVSQFFWLS